MFFLSNHCFCMFLWWNQGEPLTVFAQGLWRSLASQLENHRLRGERSASQWRKRNKDGKICMCIYIIYIYIFIYMSVCIIILQMLLAVYMWCFMIVACLLLHLSVHLFSGSSVRLCHYASIDIPSVLSKFPPHVANINRSKTRPGFLWVHFILRKHPRLLLRLHSIEVNACNVSTPRAMGSHASLTMLGHQICSS